APPGWVGPTPPDDRGHLSPPCLDRSAGRDELGPQHHLGWTDRRRAVGGGEPLDSPLTLLERNQVHPPIPTEAGRDVRSVAARVHAQRAADRSGDPARPLESPRTGF